MSAPEYAYSGTELDVFALAQNWKRYWGRQIAPYLAGEVLEVGAGIGTNTLQLQNGNVKRWCCLEPDGSLLRRLDTNTANKTVVPTEIRQGTVAELAREGREFDTVIYIDVLEHIEDDAAEVRLALSCLRSGGKLLVLSPAHQWLFTAFDRAIGHYRRYTATMLRKLTPSSAQLLRTWYLDTAGLSLSLGNRMLLKQAKPTPKQILTWDRLIIPISQVLDWLLAYRFGKTVLAAWQKR